MIALLAAVAMCLAACGGGQSPPPPGPSTARAYGPDHIDPANIERMRRDVPPGYEVAAIDGRGTPLTSWGFGAGATADPTQCGVLADPGMDAATARGWSASGAGGIVYVAVSASADGSLDPVLLDQCGTWTLASSHTHGTVTAVAGPAVDGAATVTMTVVAATAVEGGTETASHAQTATAYLGRHVAFVTVVTDPGSPNPPLDPDFAADLLVKTVAALRG